MAAKNIKVAEMRGFVRGVAWAIALLHQHPQDAEALLFESGLTLVDFVDARVEGEDLRRIKAVAKLGGTWDRKTANDGDSERIEPL
jgi:hypothetical protein